MLIWKFILFFFLDEIVIKEEFASKFNVKSINWSRDVLFLIYDVICMTFRCDGYYILPKKNHIVYKMIINFPKKYFRKMLHAIEP